MRTISYTVTLFLLTITVKAKDLVDVTHISLGDNLKGKVVAFGDFNADKNTDIFLLTENGKDIEILITSREKDTRYSLHTLLTTQDDTVITSVVPADFDGDSQLDLFITRMKKGSTTHNVRGEIHWGMSSSLKLEDNKAAYLFTEEFSDQPIVFDYNGDMIPDLMGEKFSTKERFYWVFIQGQRNCTEVKSSTSTQNLTSLHEPQTSAFIDLDSDLVADIAISTSPLNTVPQLEVWTNKAGVFNADGSLVFPYPAAKVYGQLTFIDMGLSGGHTSVLLPVCKDEKCTSPVIYLLLDSKWISLPINFVQHGIDWTFVPPDISSDFYLPISLRVGDFNLDGYPDLLAVLRNESNSGVIRQRAFLLKNVQCSGSQCNGSTRTFQIDYNTHMHPSTELAILPTFFDYLEDGVLDILTTSYTKDKGYHIHLYKQDFTDDASFLKVMVVSGLCFDNCPSSKQPYGVNQRGAVVRYSTLDAEGKTQTAIASQLPKSAYNPLQLPFITFGLGQTPNFIESLEVGIPHPQQTSTRKKTWNSIIPNSQLIVIPYPNNKPDSWVTKLFVTPSRLVLLTGATLLGTCGFIAGIVGILHWREKVEDKREKLQEAHKFHFDAM